MLRNHPWILLVILTLLCQPAFTGDDFQNTRLTIYNVNLGLVYQEKELALNKGANTLRIEGVSRQVQPATVKLNFPKISRQVRIEEQNYLYDLVNTDKIFSKYIGEQVTFRLKSGETITGELLSNEREYVILRLPEDHIRVLTTANIIDYEFPALPGGLILKPTLEWALTSAYKGKTVAQLSYLTGGMSWHAEYVLVLDKAEKGFVLNSWISLDNQSGTTFENANVKLIAGDIHRARDRRERVIAAHRPEAMPALEKQAVETREIADYHLYELPGRVTLRHSEMKQVSLFDEISAAGKKVYLFENRSARESAEPLKIVFRIENTEQNGMGMALPQGIVRIFKRDTDESLQFIGEDHIDHTSRKDTLHLTIGNAFDVRGKRTVTELERSSKTSETATVNITITNRKNSRVEVEVHEYLYGYWEIKKSSHEYKKLSSRRIIFPLSVPADQATTITYTFFRRW